MKKILLIVGIIILIVIGIFAFGSSNKTLPVDVYVPGCPPRPEQILDGIIKIQELVQNESLRRRNSPEYKELLASYGIQ